MWRNLNLRAQILIGYGVVLALAGGLALFLVLQVGDLNRRIATINASVAADAEAGMLVAARAADVQQAVNFYLQHPRAESRDAADASFAALDADIAQLSAGASGESQRARLAGVMDQLSIYRLTFLSLSALMDSRAKLSERLNMQLFEASSLAGGEISGEFLVRRGGLNAVSELTEAQQRLQLTNLLMSRALAEHDSERAAKALDQITAAQERLLRNSQRPAPSTGLLEAVDEATSAVVTVRQLADNIAHVRQTRDEQLKPQAQALKRSADAVAAGALGALTDATADLQRQAQGAQQLAGLAMMATGVVALLAGLRLARGVLRPVVDLARAVERVNGGDYDAAVAHGGGGEIGRLAAAFNQMTATLRRQRGEVRAQQEALAEHNRGLAQALDDLRAATDAREQLATAVQAMSVPVVPILRGVIVVPLVGEIDAERAQVLLRRLLAGVTDEQARIVILDITGVPFVDAALAGWLLQAAAAAELLGARCVLVGISPEVAQALVMSGADLGRLTTYADLRQGVEHAMRAMRSRAQANV
ncbi:MAG: hypothetical protein RLZZ387_2086 [Chloroflexota bacterium]|jgi:anti-anti-sigma factor